MQTFLPYPDFHATAKVLDYRRLGKQRLETLQILRTLMGESDGWRNHPCTRMWADHPAALAAYGTYIVGEWRYRGYEDNLWGEVQERWERLRPYRKRIRMPSWLGDFSFHRDYRVLLARKKPSYYLEKFEDVTEADLEGDFEFLWPL